ncbi:hypothetical protein F4818DRAFT_423706 [Hypoxylon cercidicola]|nr:hypothetical protein F4818DRAFT_423706 [Hypoxylon cercidicola]
MSHAYYLDYQRHTFSGDELAIRPVAPSDAAAEPPLASTPVLYADVHRGRLTLRRQPASFSGEVAKSTYATGSADIEIKAGGSRTKLTHSYAQVGADGRSRENAKPQKTFWRGRVKDGSRGCYVGVLPDGTRLRWEPAGPKEDADVAKKAKTRAERMQPKLRCVRVDGHGASMEVLGEIMKSNDVVRMKDELQGQGGSPGVYVLLGFVSLYERARARNRRKAELEFEVGIPISLFPRCPKRTLSTVCP